MSAIYDTWLQICNGELDLIDEVVAEDFVGHWADAEVTGRDGLRHYLVKPLETVPDGQYELQLDPIEQNEFVVGRWLGTGTYSGVHLGEQTAVGAPVSFAGTDILRVQNGMITECWASSDWHYVARQLEESTFDDISATSDNPTAP